MAGQIFYKTSTRAKSQIYRSPARSALFSVYVSQIGGSTPFFDADIEHKNPEDTSWQTASFASMTVVGSYSIVIGDLRTEYRWSVTTGGGADAWSRVTLFDPQPEIAGPAFGHSPSFIAIGRP